MNRTISFFFSFCLWFLLAFVFSFHLFEIVLLFDAFPSHFSWLTLAVQFESAQHTHTHTHTQTVSSVRLRHTNLLALISRTLLLLLLFCLSTPRWLFDVWKNRNDHENGESFLSHSGTRSTWWCKPYGENKRKNKHEQMHKSRERRHNVLPNAIRKVYILQYHGERQQLCDATQHETLHMNRWLGLIYIYSQQISRYICHPALYEKKTVIKYYVCLFFFLNNTTWSLFIIHLCLYMVVLHVFQSGDFSFVWLSVYAKIVSHTWIK